MRLINPLLTELFMVFFWGGAFGLLLLISGIVSAEITFDGSLGVSGTPDKLDGSDYQIKANQGTQVDSNLFHSFETFNINSGEIATFTDEGAIGNINNVLARVTGGELSQINGLLRSTISGANLFFLNPAGIIFGPSAKLNVLGAFHVSTANYIGFSDGGRFDANLSTDDSLLTIAQPEVFGFLGDKQPGTIHFEDSELSPSNNQSLSIIGGDISITENSLLGNRNPTSGVSIELISVASAGEINFANDQVDTSSFSKMGNINLGSASLFSNPVPGGIAGNQIVIRGGQLLLKNTVASTNFNSNAENINAIDIVLTDKLLMQGEKSSIRLFGNGLDLNVDVNKLEISKGAVINNTNTDFNFQNNIRNNIYINAKDILVDSISDSSQKSNILGVNNSDITIKSDELQLKLIDGGSITTEGGDIFVQAKSITLNGVKDNARAGLFASPARQGDSGQLTLSSESLIILNGARVSTSTLAPSTGSSGSLKIIAKKILLDGKHGDNLSSISAEPQGGLQNSGDDENDRGELRIQTDTLILQNQGIISTNTRGPRIGGIIRINAKTVKLKNQGKISSESRNENLGKAGTIVINANNALILSDNSKITVDTEQADAGNIDINAGLLHLHQQSSITTSVAGGTGDGGNINISPTLLIINDASNIIANAQEGNAGNIDIQINDNGTLFKSLDSVIEASSQLGINGNVEINAPDVDITSGFKPLPDTFLDVASILQKPCIRRFQGNSIQFVNQKYQVLPDSPYALRTVSYIQPDETRLNQSTSSAEEPIVISKDQSHITDCL